MLTEQDSRHPILVRSASRKRIAWQFREVCTLHPLTGQPASSAQGWN